MRLGLIIYGSLNQQTGGYLYDRKVVEYLQAQGDQVEILSLPWRSYISHLSDNLSLTLLTRLSHLEVDLLIEDELNHPSLFAINHLVRRRKNFPLTSIVHHLRYSEVTAIWQRPVYRAIEGAFLRSLDGLICNSQTTLRSVQTVLSRKLASSIPWVVAYPGKDHFSGGVSESEIEERARQPGPLRLLFLGNLIPRKGLHWLLAALSRLRDIPFRLDVVGDDSRDLAYARQIRGLVEKYSLQGQVYIWGAVGEHALQEILRQAHLLVVPSAYEGFGIAYLDGMRYGLAILASTGGGAGELVTEGVEGYLIQPGDVSTLANRLQELHHERTRLTQMGIAARKRFEQHPTWSESAAKIRQFLLNLTH